MSFMAEADKEWARRVGEEHPDQPWVLSDRDVWHPNPFYRGFWYLTRKPIRKMTEVERGPPGSPLTTKYINDNPPHEWNIGSDVESWWIHEEKDRPGACDRCMGVCHDRDPGDDCPDCGQTLV